MRVPDSKRRSKFWSRLSLKRWLTRKQNTEEFLADDIDDTESEFDDEELLDYGFEKTRHSCSGADFEFRRSISACPQPRHSSAILMPQDSEILRSKLSETQQFKIFVGTWNVGGKPPNEEVVMEEWLGLEEPADIYVLGFQEVVPLNAGNVLGSENKVPADRWLHLIRHTLNNTECQSLKRSYTTPSSMWQGTGGYTTNTSIDNMKDSMVYTVGSMPLTDRGQLINELHTTDIMTDVLGGPLNDVREPVLNEAQLLQMRDSSHMGGQDAPCLSPSFSTRSLVCRSSLNCKSRYTLIASKQMVGIFMSIWIRGDLRRHVRNLKVSCVGCGLLGYLGNKGSISISMCLHQTSFCFVCSHLTSGQRDKDELRRNSDVSVILKRTQFSCSGDLNCMDLPESILEHDRVIWLGDLNYRLALTPSDTRSLLAQEDWNTLLEKDQLNIHRKAGRVFGGWHEGQICFAPTYKYRANSDCYALEKLKGEKRRTPAWCDRILWYGSGLKQLAYVRAEARLSDHRPVYAIFSAEVEALSRQKLEDFLLLNSAKVQAEELLVPPFQNDNDNTRPCEI